MLDYDAVQTAICDLRKKQIFFIGGTVKSGTTWLQLLLDAHPDVSCNGEGHFGSGLAPILKPSFDRYNQLIAQETKSAFGEIAGYQRLTDDDFQFLLATCIGLSLLRQSKRKTARAIGEKTPSNIRYLDLLHTLFPSAKFLHIVRDGRDCAVSGWFHNLRIGRDWTMRNFASIDAYAIKHAESWAKELAAAQIFADKNPDLIRQLRYEDLVADTEQILADLFAFLSVDASETVLVQCRTAASFEVLSGGRAAGQENRNSFFRKGMPGDWRNYLSEEINAGFRNRAGEWLDRFGYR
jgi:Sulfotransferase family